MAQVEEASGEAGYRQPGDETKCIAYRKSIVKCKETSKAVYLASSSFSELKMYVLKSVGGVRGSQADKNMLLAPVMGMDLKSLTMREVQERGGGVYDQVFKAGRCSLKPAC